MMPTLLEANDLDVAFGQVEILHSVSVSLHEGEHIGLFGPNGHGKTTLLETISGLHVPRTGSVVFRGSAITGLAPRTIVELGLVHVPQGNTLFPRMTVEENLWLGAYSKRVWKRRRDRARLVYELFPRLAERRKQLCRTLSGGERQMLAIGAGLMADGEVLMLDEPTLGLAPKLKDELRDAISQIAKSGLQLVLVEQDVDFLLSLTDRLYLIQDGRVALETAREGHDLDHSQILDMYFGGTPGLAAAPIAQTKGGDGQ